MEWAWSMAWHGHGGGGAGGALGGGDGGGGALGIVGRGGHGTGGAGDSEELVVVVLSGWRQWCQVRSPTATTRTGCQMLLPSCSHMVTK